jgi:uncharacterized cupredoxin-like copper-binding protein
MTNPTVRLGCCAAVAVGALALTACGSSSKSSSSSTPAPAPAATSSSSSSSSSGGGQTIDIAAVEKNGLSFNKKTLTAKAGKVTIVMANPSGNAQGHGVSVEGKGVDQDGNVVQPGGTSKVTATLKAGTYEFYCPVPGHRQAGMEGKLVVQ